MRKIKVSLRAGMRRLTGLSQRIQGLSHNLAFTEFSIGLWHDGPARQISSVIGGVYDDAISAGRLAILGLMCILPTGSFAYTGQDLAGTAKVSIEQARSIALRARSGAITSEELEKEKGGSGLRYSFGIKNGKVLYEVGVDAETGKVPRKLERRAESGLAVKAMLGCKSRLSFGSEGAASS